MQENHTTGVRDPDAGWRRLADADDIDGAPARVELDGEPWVAVRLGDELLVARDRCPHRGAPLSLGHVDGDCLRCPYHGWAFDASGRCTEVPALGPDATVPPRARLVTADVVEHDGVLFVGSDEPTPPTSARALVNDDPGLRRGWHPVCRSTELASGDTIDVELLGATWSVRRTPAGQLAADGAHDIADHLGHIWLAPSAPLVDLPVIPEYAEDGWHLVPMPRYEGRFGMGLLLDNQLDAGHFSFVHRNTFGSPDRAEIAPYDVDRDGLGFEVVLRVPITARNDVTDHAAVRAAEQYRTMTYRYRAPASLFLRLDYEEMGGSTGILFCFTPLDATRCRTDVDLLFRHPDGFTDEQLAERLAFEVQVVGEDMALQAAFDFVELPLSLPSEVHTRADRASVEMRRILTQLIDHL